MSTGSNYIRTQQGFSYLSLITDAYSRKVVGYALYPTLEAVGCMQALRMAIASRKRESPYILIHYSDRGVQYCCSDYVSLLEAENMAISMTQTGSSYDNPQAERVNGTVKNEFSPNKTYRHHQEAEKEIARVIAIYNQKRPHDSLDYLTPEQAHQRSGELK